MSFTLNPFQPHCGPFNSIRKKANGDVDRICRMHDLAYKSMGPKAYTHFSNADAKFIARMQRKRGLAPWVYSRVFKLKKMMASRLSEKKENNYLTIDPPKMARTKTAYPSPTITPRKRRISNATPPPPNKRVASVKPKLRITAKGVSGGGRGSSKKKSRTSRKSANRGKKIAKSKVAFEKQCMDSGYVVTQEAHGKVTDPNCVFIGHGTGSYGVMIDAVAFSIVRRMFKKIDNFSDWDAPVEAPIATATLYLVEENQLDGAITNRANTVLTGLTYRQVKAWLYTQFTSYIISEEAKKRLIALRLYEVAKGTIETINLRSLMVKYHIQSDLKYQNVSFTADALGDDDNALNVDRIPLIGKGYGSRGPAFENKTVVGANRTRPFAIDYQFGVVANTGERGYTNGTYKPYSEPPSHLTFNKTWSLGGVKASPGIVKRDTIITQIDVTLHKFLWNVGYEAGPEAYVYRPYAFGKVHMFALEKEINLTTDLIKVGYEVNQKHMCLVTGGYGNTPMLSMFAQGDQGTIT